MRTERDVGAPNGAAPGRGGNIVIQSLYHKLKAVPLVLLGLGLCRAWSVAMFCGAYPNVFSGAFMLFAASTAVGGLVLAALAPRVSPLYKNGHLLLAAALLMGLGTAGFGLFSFAIPNQVVLAAMTVGAGLGGAVLQLAWCECLGCFNPMRVCLYHAGAIGLGAVLAILIYGLAPLWVAVVAVILPLVSLLWCHEGIKLADERDLPTGRDDADAVTFPWKPVALMAVCSFASGFNNMDMQGEGMNMLGSLGELCVMAAVVLGVLADRRRFNFASLFKFAMPLTVISLMLVVPAFGSMTGVSAFCYSGGDAALSVLVMVIMCSLVYRFGVNAVRLNGIERGVRYLCLAGGWILHELVADALALESLAVVQAVVLAAVVVAFVAIFYTEDSLASLWGAAVKTAEVTPEAEMRAARAIAAGRLAKEYSLTPREGEVLQLLAQGTSLLDIEKSLFIAQGTLRAHINHIYTKMDIHSRDELRALIEKAVQAV